MRSELIAAQDEIESLRSDGTALKQLFQQYNLQFQEETQNISKVLELIQNPASLRFLQSDYNIHKFFYVSELRAFYAGFVTTYNGYRYTHYISITLYCDKTLG